MSAIQAGPFRCEWRVLTVLPKFRQVAMLVFGLAATLITLVAIHQGEGPLLIGALVGMGLTTILLIFGVDIQRIEVSAGQFTLVIPFEDTQERQPDGDEERESEDVPVIGRDE